MTAFNGYPSYACWNVCLYIDNDHDNYTVATRLFDDLKSKRASLHWVAVQLFNALVAKYSSYTPDGAKITLLSCRRWFEYKLADEH